MKIQSCCWHSKTCEANFFAVGLVAALLCARLARADDAAAPPPAAAPAPPAPPPKKWDSSATAGVTLTRGNSHTFLATLALGTKRSWTNDEALFGAAAGYGETTSTVNGNKVDTTTDSYVRGYGQWNHLFTPHTYAGLRLEGEHDDVAALAYRLTVSPLAGYYFTKTTNSFLAGEIGPSYVSEKFFDQNVHSYLALRIGERGEHKYATGAKIWESVEWIPKVEDFQNYLVNAVAGVTAPISKPLNISFLALDTYKNVPAAGKQKNDFKLIAGLTYNF